MATHQIDDFHFGAEVHTSDGVHVGALQRLLIDEPELAVTAIVVKETRRFSGHGLAGAGMLEDDIAIPVTAVASVTRERIDLRVAAAEARRVPPYLTYQYAPATWGDAPRIAFSTALQVPYAPGMIEQAHKKLSVIEVRPGENVMIGHTGRKLGTVRDVLMEGAELIGIVVHPTGWFKEDVLLQVRFLGRSDDAALFVHMTEEDIAALQPFHPQ